MTTHTRRRYVTGAASITCALAAVAWLAPAPASADDPALTVFDWAGYEDPSFHPAYVEAHGASPTFAFFGDEEEAFQKIRAGFRADLAHPCSQSVVKWRDAGLLRPIDTGRIEAWDDIIPGLRDLEGFASEGEQWFVPFEWGNTGLIYRTDVVDAAALSSLRVLADPAYAGRVSLPDNVDDAFALGALVVGVRDWTQMTDAEFQAAAAFLREVAPNVRMYWTDNTELAQAMATGEIVLAWGWNETPTHLQADGYPVAMHKNTEEGIFTWVCGYVLLAGGAGSEDRAYDYLNAVLAVESGHFLLDAWGYGHANAEAIATADPTVVEASGFADFEQFTDRTLFAAPLPEALRQRMISEFERIKAGF